MRKISIVDCNIGNRAAIRNMLKRLGENPVITPCPKQVDNSEIIILPGIGSYDSFMLALVKLGLYDTIKEAALNSKKTILGICIGMQALFDHSEEGVLCGLGLIGGTVEHLKKSFKKESQLKIPHIGWTEVTSQDYKNEKEYYYFAHSYHCVPLDKNNISSYFEFGNKKFVSAVRKNNIWGVQFHPEKSHIHGIKFFQKFLADA